MTTNRVAKQRSPRRWFSPRFSLRLLMLLVTAAAVGSAFWWRWPVTQTTEKRQGSSVTKETSTYHRGLWGNLIKHGVHRETVDGEVVLEEHYREGLRHGPYRSLRVTGEFLLGEPHGTWRFEPREHWNGGKLWYSLEYKNGRVIGDQNHPSASLLARRVSEGTLDQQMLSNALFADVDLEYPETPLSEVIEDLRERFNLPLAMRWKRKTVVLAPPPQPDEPPLPAMHEIPFSDDWILLEPEDLEAARHLVDMRPRSLASPIRPAPPAPVVKNIHDAPVNVSLKQITMLAGFDAILTPLELVLDFRYGVFCVVDAQDAADWEDVTGVMQLRPSPKTPLADRLDLPAQLTSLEPLRDVLQHFAATQEIPVEFRPANERTVVLASIPDDELPRLVQGVIRYGASTNPKRSATITLRQLLGLLLDQANLHCYEENGVLIIEPPKNVPTIQAKASSP
ncbi:MAG: toxin-antitoxin system YwqK family antitoxin [Pirellulaceae bacterium]